MGTSRQGSDDTVFGGGCGAGVVASLEVGVSGLSVDGCGFVRMDEDVKEGDGSVGRRVLQGEGEVVSEGVDEGEEGVCVLSVSEESQNIVNEMAVEWRRIRRRGESKFFNFCNSYFC